MGGRRCDECGTPEGAYHMTRCPALAEYLVAEICKMLAVDPPAPDALAAMANAADIWRMPHNSSHVHPLPHHVCAGHE